MLATRLIPTLNPISTQFSTLDAPLSTCRASTPSAGDLQSKARSHTVTDDACADFRTSIFVGCAVEGEAMRLGSKSAGASAARRVLNFTASERAATGSTPNTCPRGDTGCQTRGLPLSNSSFLELNFSARGGEKCTTDKMKG